ncbi:hypothetical protein PF011_g26409 [Phytophthora fragariae]|uniref:Reverse transcriptase Ty1/copia-type domain-containing protein n=1 Tax=Phytophthora fragariae TaxID=53985 RepID=A0A6A3HLC0_9STRA|nr:hypothetical protein PF011_g26409 [Phytophthora fragariae]
MYLACGTQPDISVAVAKLSRFLDNPGEKHWDASIKVVRHLLKTKDVGIVYDGLLGTQLEPYSDADWAGNRDDRRSVRGMLLILCGAPVVWRSTFQKTVALSDEQAEEESSVGGGLREERRTGGGLFARNRRAQRGVDGQLYEIERIYAKRWINEATSRCA